MPLENTRFAKSGIEKHQLATLHTLGSRKKVFGL
jgi:hypothetical protein